MAVAHSAAIWRSTIVVDATPAQPSACLIKKFPIADFRLPIGSVAASNQKSASGNRQ
jgi:hypothetical protein